MRKKRNQEATAMFTECALGKSWYSLEPFLGGREGGEECAERESSPI